MKPLVRQHKGRETFLKQGTDLNKGAVKDGDLLYLYLARFSLVYLLASIVPVFPFVMRGHRQIRFVLSVSLWL